MISSGATIPIVGDDTTMVAVEWDDQRVSVFAVHLAELGEVIGVEGDEVLRVYLSSKAEC